MEYFLLVVFLILQCSHTYALDLLPAPINVSMDSHNFRNELRWDPGPGSPPGTSYKVFARINRKRPAPKTSNKTRAVLKLLNEPTYNVSVQAVYNDSLLSPESTPIKFSPSKQTKIDPPGLTLVGGEHCLEVNISLPKAHRSAKIKDILKFYDGKVTISWKKDGDMIHSMDTTDSSVVLDNLEAGVQYCVWVQMRIRTNPNTPPSKSFCAFTNDPEPSGAVTIIGISVPVVLLMVVCGMVLLFVLHYTGLLCGIKAVLPAVLQMMHTMMHTIMTPETTVHERVHLNPEADQRKARNAQLQTSIVGSGFVVYYEDEDDDYVNRAADISSEPDSQDAPGDSSRNNGGSACPSADGTAVESQLDFRGHSGQGPAALDEDPRENAGSAMSQGEWSEVGVSVDVRFKEEGDEEAEEEGNVNLFSVTLLKEDDSGNINLCSAIFGSFEETADNELEMECAPRGSLPPLQDREPHRTPRGSELHICTPSVTEEMFLPAILDPGQPHGGDTGYQSRGERSGLGTSLHNLIPHGGETDNEEEQEEEDISGYLGRC